MNFNAVLKKLYKLFEKKRKNRIALGKDEPLESNLKFLQIKNTNTPIQLSENTVNIEGNLKVNGVDVSTEPDDDTDTGATQLNELSDVTYSSGDLTIDSLDTIVCGALTIDSSADIIIDAGGANVEFHNGGVQKHDFKGGSHKLVEMSTAVGDTAGMGQVWVHDDTPNTLYFTNDAGNDIQITNGSELHQKYVYDSQFVGYSAAALAVYLPMNGYIVDVTSLSTRNEFASFIAPFDGTIQKFGFRSEIAQDGNFRILIQEASDGTEMPGTTFFRKDASYDIADDTYQELALTSPSIGSDNAPMTKGKLYAIQLTTPSNSEDTNVTIVFKWDITS